MFTDPKLGKFIPVMAIVSVEEGLIMRVSLIKSVTKITPPPHEADQEPEFIFHCFNVDRILQ